MLYRIYSNQVEHLSLLEIGKGSHDGSEVVHIAVVFRIARIIAWGIELIDLSLETLVRFRVCSKAEEQASQSARSGVRACDDRKNPVTDKLDLWGRGSVGQVFVALFTMARK